MHHWGLVFILFIYVIYVPSATQTLIYYGLAVMLFIYLPTATQTLIYHSVWSCCHAPQFSLYDYSSPGFSMSTGHFTQMVWRSTTQLGCAMVGPADCPNGISHGTKKYAYMLVCQYSPPGRITHNDMSDNVTIDLCKRLFLQCSLLEMKRHAFTFVTSGFRPQAMLLGSSLPM
jgi:hypothetical protein